jgi:hypothetical protein
MCDRTCMDFVCSVSDYTVILSTNSKPRRRRVVGEVRILKLAGRCMSPGVRQVLRTRVASSAIRVRRLCAGVPFR